MSTRRFAELADNKLISLFKEGDKKAIDILFSRHKIDLEKLIRQYIKSKTAAEDMIQEVFIKIFTSLKENRYNEEGKFLPWAFRVAHNLCMDHLRKIKNVSVHLPEEKIEWKYASGDICAEGKMIRNQQEQRLYNLLANLNADQKKVVDYRYFEELSFKEIANLMDTNVSTSLGRMRYGIQHLRKMIHDDASFVWR